MRRNRGMLVQYEARLKCKVMHWQELGQDNLNITRYVRYTHTVKYLLVSWHISDIFLCLPTGTIFNPGIGSWWFNWQWNSSTRSGLTTCNLRGVKQKPTRWDREHLPETVKTRLGLCLTSEWRVRSIVWGSWEQKNTIQLPRAGQYETSTGWQCFVPKIDQISTSSVDSGGCKFRSVAVYDVTNK